MRPLLTIGYQGATAPALLDRLRAEGVTRILDVRAIPMSRKAGFSKRLLHASALERGLGYVHLPGLGTPKPGRDAARRGDVDALERIYAGQLATGPARTALAEALGLAADATCCLLCFEEDPRCCHRRLVADRLVAAGPFAVRHLRG